MRSFAQHAFLLALAVSVPAAAQQNANPVAEHYRSYRGALERGDLVAADTEVAAALAQSQARDGTGGATAVLAIDLALVRLSEGNRAQALAPANLAASLANNPQSHVDPMLADIVVKRASLAPGDQSAASLTASLAAAQARGGFDEYVYDGAADLGRWALDQRQLPTALGAWRMAVQASPGASDGAALARARALVGVGTTLFLMDVATTTPMPAERLQPLPLRSGHNEVQRPNLDVLRALVEAVQLLRPLALRSASDGSLTEAQLEYSRATVFMLADESRLSDFNVDMSAVSVPDNHSLQLPAHPGETPCIPQVIAHPMPHFPPAEQGQGNLGAVMARLVVDDAGHVSDARVVATVGGAAFAQSISSVISHWRVQRSTTSPPGCHMAMTAFVPIDFMLAS